MEYESRRDADDAYHEMHNKRLGRDDVLKIEVRGSVKYHYESKADSLFSGPVRHLQHPGVLILAVTRVQVAVVSALPVVDVHRPLLVEAGVIIPLEKTIAANVIMTDVIETAISVLEVPKTATAR